MIKKYNNSRRKLIVILVIITVIFGIMLCVLHIMKTLEVINDDENKYISKANIEKNLDSYTIEEILKYYECKLISYSYENDIDGQRYCKINLRFKYKLYEGQESKEEYYNKIISALSRKFFVPYKLIDDNFNVDIYVDSENDICTINGIENFYENNSYIKVNSHDEKFSINNYDISSELSLIIANDWSRIDLKINSDIKDIQDDFIDYGEFKINYTDRNINYIIFTKDYKNKVLENIKVGDSLEAIKNKLGEPSKESKNEFLVYKDDKIYIFFYEDEIVVYPSSFRYYNSNYFLEKEIVDYYEGNYKDSKSLFVKKIIDENLDFKSEVIDDYVKVSSYLRGIDLIFYDNKKLDITIYDNYRINTPLKKLAESKKVHLDYENNSIYLNELERISNR